jgi:hypothetical protein
VAAEVDDIIKKAVEEFRGLSFFRDKGNTIARVIQEAPEEISYITEFYGQWIITFYGLR